MSHSNYYRALFGSKLIVSGGHRSIKIWASSEKYSQRDMAATGQSMARILSSALVIFCKEDLGGGVYIMFRVTKMSSASLSHEKS